MSVIFVVMTSARRNFYISPHLRTRIKSQELDTTQQKVFFIIMLFSTGNRKVVKLPLPCMVHYNSNKELAEIPLETYCLVIVSLTCEPWFQWTMVTNHCFWVLVTWSLFSKICPWLKYCSLGNISYYKKKCLNFLASFEIRFLPFEKYFFIFCKS